MACAELCTSLAIKLALSNKAPAIVGSDDTKENTIVNLIILKI